MLFCGIAGLLGSNDFAMQAKCSNISERNIRDMNWIRVSVALGEFLLVALIFAITLVCKEFRSVTERFFIYLLLATLFREAVLVANVEHQFEYWVMDEVCSVLGALDLYTAGRTGHWDCCLYRGLSLEQSSQQQTEITSIC